jgi:hypothetical protein
MDSSGSLLDRFRDLLGLPQAGRGQLILLGGAALVVILVLVVLLFIVRRLFAKSAAGPTQERGVEGEDLGTYPPPPPPGAWSVIVEGVPVRIRLVIVAPIGKGNPVDADNAATRLDQVVRGLGPAIQQDKARIRVWPMQLSNQGFGPTLHRQVTRPEPDGKPSRWIVIAGQTPARPKPLLVGLALQADEVNSIGRLTLTPEQWSEVLRVQGR